MRTTGLTRSAWLVWLTTGQRFLWEFRKVKRYLTRLRYCTIYCTKATFCTLTSFRSFTCNSYVSALIVSSSPSSCVSSIYLNFPEVRRSSKVINVSPFVQSVYKIISVKMDNQRITDNDRKCVGQPVRFKNAMQKVRAVFVPSWGENQGQKCSWCTIQARVTRGMTNLMRPR